jgi:cytochrome c oxidase subunit 1
MTVANPPLAAPVEEAPARDNHPPSRVRTCATTGLRVCTDAERYVQLNAVAAVIFLTVGGFAALLLGLTRWPRVHLLDAVWYYRLLTAHGLSMLIFWIIFFEVAVLYFVGTTLLNTRLFSRKVALASFAQMALGALLTEGAVFAGTSDVLMTSYAPLRAHPAFYLGIILFATGTLTALFNYFATLYIAKRDHTYQGSVPRCRSSSSAPRPRPSSPSSRSSTARSS